MTENIETAELRVQVTELERIVAAQAEALDEARRRQAACEAHNEMLLGRLRLVEGTPVAVQESVGHYINAAPGSPRQR